MTTVYIHPTTGDDTRTFTQAQSTSTPWKTPMKAFNNASVLAGDTISIGTPGAGALTWSGIDAVVDSRGSAGTSTNASKAVIWQVATGVQALFTTVSGASYLPGPYGSSIDREGPDSHPVRGHCWRFIDPAAMQFNFTAASGGTVTFTQTGALPTNSNVGGGYSSCLYFVDKASGANHKVAIDGLIITRYDGMGVMFNNVGGSDVRNYDISHCVTGIRWEGTRANGTRVATSLSGATLVGAATVTVASATGMAAGDCVVIGNDSDVDTEVRQIASIAGTVLSLSPGPSSRTGLHYPHASGCQVRTQFGARNGKSHNNDCYGINDVTGGNDFGSEGYTLNKGANHVLIWRNEDYDNFGAVASFDYGIDGGALTPYAMDGVSMNVVSENDWHGSHSLLESGTQASENLVGHNDGSLIFTFNTVWGLSDRQSTFGNNPSAPLGLFRAAPNWVIRRNSLWVTNGSTGAGGFRWNASGVFAGELDGIRLIENIIALDYSTAANQAASSAVYDFSAVSVYPGGGTSIDRNLFYRTRGTNPAARAKSGGGTFAYPSGLAAWTTASGFSANDLWGSDPFFTAPLTGDLTLQPGSPAATMAANGDAIGAYDFASPSVQFQDDFGRTAATLGNADVGGAWSQNLQGTSTLSTDGSTGVATIATAGNTVRAALFGVSQSDTDLTFEFEADKVPAGSAYEWLIGARASNSNVDNGGYFAHIVVTTAAVVQANIVYRGTNTQVAVTTIGAVTGAPAFAANTRWAGRLQLSGATPTAVRLRVWRKSDGQPATWFINITDNTGPQGPGALNIRAVAQAGTTNVPVALKFDAVLGSNLASSDVTTLDTLAVTDGTLRRFVGLRTAAQSLTLGDSPVRVIAAARSTSDALAFSDAASPLKGTPRTSGEGLTLSNTASRRVTAGRSLTDSVTTSDLASRNVVLKRYPVTNRS
ncbi:MAG: hypothetical protein H0V07_05860 [Propionibacteriales bacterium]|nr:hypothetical protein [Propionibacteriales bacterium]